MAHEFTDPPPVGSDFHNHLSTPFPNFLSLDDPNMDHFHFTDQQNPTSKATDLDTSPVILLSASDFQNLPMSFPEFPGGPADAFPRAMFHPGEHVSGLVPRTVPAMGNGLCDSRKRKAPDVFGNSSGKSDEGRAKRVKNAGKVEGEEQEEEGKPRKGVHVRAGRGQATDSHSLAERVRRGRIKERLRCLQDIVPGCYKTMGLAVMLDEIINYVQSLQNQVEFLSMKLTAASSYYDFNSESDAIDKVQRAMAGEAKKLQRVAREGSSEGNQSNDFHNVSWYP